jgi:hypothetical protein
VGIKVLVSKYNCKFLSSRQEVDKGQARMVGVLKRREMSGDLGGFSAAAMTKGLRTVTEGDTL